MWCKMNTNFFLFALIVLATTGNLVRAQAPAPILASEHVTEIQSPQHFKDVVLASKDRMIVQFHAPWCAPCKVLGPILVEKVNEQNGKIKLARMDLATEPLADAAKEQGVRNVPVISSYKDGKVVDQLIGFKSKSSVVDFVDKQLAN